MVDADILARRVLVLNEALDQLQQSRAGDVERLRADPMLRAAAERWMQLAIESCIDAAFHVVAARGWTPPDTARGAFAALAAHDMIDGDLATRLGSAAGMRNVLVHHYAEVDLDKVAAAVRDDLGHLQAFGAAMAKLIA